MVLRFLAVLVLTPLGACTDSAGGDPCDGVRCSGHGRCVDVGEGAACLCDAGFVATGALGCVSTRADGAPGGDTDGPDAIRG